MSAERGEELNRSQMSSLFLGISRFFSSCSTQIHHFYFSKIKIPWLLFFWDMEKEILYRVLCKNKFHKLVRKGLSVSYGEKIEDNFHIEYLQCINCEYMFFTNLKDKQTYEKFYSNKRKNHKNFIDSCKFEIGKEGLQNV